jgi:hypothetical protein
MTLEQSGAHYDERLCGQGTLLERAWERENCLREERHRGVREET